jgi:glycosyltransferase involved in cell wall biosynthesis
MGHKVTISSYWGLQGAPSVWEGITILPGFGSGYCSTSLGEHCKAIEPDLVITLGDVWVLDANILRGIPVSHWLPADCRPMSKADQQVVDASGAQLIAMSRFGFDRFKDAGFNPVYWPHGIEMDVFKPPENRKTLRESCGIGNEFVIGVNGANNDAIRKALPEQMLAFARFNRKYPDTILTLHSGIHQDGGQDLEAVAENLGILDRIRVVDQYRYHSGLVLPSDLAEWYGAIDVLSAASFGEGFGIPIVESQACGTPVITTRASSMDEVNPLGIQVDGEPFWNGVHKGWWIKPYIQDLADAYEQAYLNRGKVNRKELRDFAGQYDAVNVTEQYAKPALGELLERMKKRG